MTSTEARQLREQLALTTERLAAELNITEALLLARPGRPGQALLAIALTIVLGASLGFVCVEWKWVRAKLGGEPYGE